MKTMKTLIVNEDCSLAVKEISMPAMNECMALVKTTASGICGSDSKVIHRTLDERGNSGLVYPLMLGHENVGRVVEVGSKVTTYKVGDLVIAPNNLPRDGYGIGWGGFGEYAVAFDYAAWDVGKYGPAPLTGLTQQVLPEFIDDADGVMLITLREVLAAIKTFELKPNENIVVYGCGSVGLTFIKFMSILGLGPIIALDLKDEQLKDALAQGADYAFNIKDPDYRKKILEIFPGGVQNVMDAVGVADIINWSFELLVNNGKICVYGVPPVLDMKLDWRHSQWNWKLYFQQMPDRIDLAYSHNQVVNWIKHGIINPKDYISDYFDFTDILKAFEMYDRKENLKKIVINYK